LSTYLYVQRKIVSLSCKVALQIIWVASLTKKIKANKSDQNPERERERERALYVMHLT